MGLGEVDACFELDSVNTWLSTCFRDRSVESNYIGSCDPLEPNELD